MRIKDLLQGAIEDQYKNNIDSKREIKTESIFIRITKTNKKILLDFCNELEIGQTEFFEKCIENIKRFKNQQTK